MPLSPLVSVEPAVLRDGAAVDVRVTTPADLLLLTQFHAEFADESRRMRSLVFGAEVDSPALLRLLPDVAGLVALAGRQVVGHGCLVPTGVATAELAFAVADAWQHRGLATVLLERLVAEGGLRGLTTLTAEVHPSNHEMISVFEDAGLPVSIHATAGSLHVELPAGLTEPVVRRFEQRHRSAAVAGLDHVLRPTSIVVVGASERRGSVGGELLRNVVDGGFAGAVHVVHPRAHTVAGVAAVRSVSDLPPGIDLAVVAVPAASVLAVAQDCATAGVRGLLVITAGFAEGGSEGRGLQEQVLDVCRSAGMRLVGPNCLGVVNTDPAARLDATFAPQHIPAGSIALASQSGAIGIVAMDAAARRGIGLSTFVSLGNRADVSSNDLLRYWADDPRTKVIALYLESFGNPRAFADAAREVSAVKPVIAVKAGRSVAGLRAAASHTGALVEGSDALTDALLAEAGVIRVDTITELLDTAIVLDRAGVPRGGRVAVLTNAGGGGIAFADAAEAAGLELEPLQPATQEQLKLLRPQAVVGNPVDLLADVPPPQYGQALDIVAADRGVDTVVAIHIPPLAGRKDDTLAVIGTHAQAATVPVVAVPLAQEAPLGLREQLAVLDTPEDAARALGRIAAYARHITRPADPAIPPPDIDRVAGAAAVAEGLARGGGWLAPDLAMRLARAYGIPVAPAAVVGSPEEVDAAAGALDGPLAVKAIAEGLTHKTEEGAVRLGVATPAAAHAAAVDLDRRLREHGFDVSGFLVQQMVSGGVELLVGAISHPTFGPVVLCGAGGTTAELWGDVQMRLAPVGPRTAAAMVGALRVSALLRGWRGAPAAQAGAVEDVVRRMSALACDRPEIAEVECNPLLATPTGAVAVDLRVRLATAGSGRLHA